MTTPLAYGRRELADKLRISGATLDRRVKDGSLPPPRSLGGRALWLAVEVDVALQALPKGVVPARTEAARRAKQGPGR